VTPEYFGVVYEIPSRMLEIEPRQSAAEYGGFGSEHDGFILPDSEAWRLRNDMALTHAVLAYRQAGPPSVQALEILRDNDQAVYSARWQHVGDVGDIDCSLPVRIAGPDEARRILLREPGSGPGRGELLPRGRLTIPALPVQSKPRCRQLRPVVSARHPSRPWRRRRTSGCCP